MNRKIIELKSGIKAHFINTDKHWSILQIYKDPETERMTP